VEEETHLEYMLKNTESKTLKTRYLDAKVLILTDTLSRIQERIDKDGINPDIGFLIMMLYVQNFIEKKIGRKFENKIYKRLSFTNWPFFSYKPLIEIKDLNKKFKLAANLLIELESPKIRKEALGYIEKILHKFWEDFNLNLNHEIQLKEIINEKKELYNKIGSQYDLERRKLVQNLAKTEGKKIKLNLINIGIIPTELCPSECRFCLSPWKCKVEDRTGRSLQDGEFKLIANPAIHFANKNGLIITLTGGEPLLELSRVLHIIKRAKTRVELTTSGFWATNMKSTNKILNKIEKAVNSNKSDNFSFSLQVSVDFFHQEVKCNENGELRETIPVKNLANLVEAVLRNYNFELCLLPKYTRYEDPLVFLLSELENRNLSSKITKKFYNPKLRISCFGDYSTSNKPALLKAYLRFDSVDKQIFLLYTSVESIGGASNLEHEYQTFKERTMNFLEQDKEEKFPLMGLEVSDDGNVYPGAHAIYSWSLGNILEKNFEEIISNLEYDPLIIAMAEKPWAIKDIALNTRPGLYEDLKDSSSPLVAIYKILEDDRLRLDITKELAGI
jgi:pyruvate-formate lyase-activating enzyme|tara:strand:+ start:351 stop:2030 length:1680 start_codon:yes stop_codon:yes gene_type:complete